MQLRGTTLFLAGVAVSMVGLGAGASVADDAYLDQLQGEASATTVVSTRMAAPAGSSDEVIAARLGVTTPYGRKALESELRSYYPGAYRVYRGLDRVQVEALWQVYDQTGSAVKVLETMDKLVAR